MNRDSIEGQIIIRLAKIISFIFNPILVPLLSIIILLFFTHLSITFTRQELFRIIDVVFRFTIVLPFMSIFLLHKLNHFSLSPNVTTYQRIVGSFMICSLCYLFIAIVMKELSFSFYASNIIASCCVLALFIVIPYKWNKTSKIRSTRDEYHLLALSILNRRQDRYMPLVVTLVSYIFCAMMMFKKSLPWYINAIIIASILILAVHLLLNRKWRISEHMAAMGGVTGGILALNKLFEYDPLPGIIFSISLAGLLGTSRMILKHNNLGELLFGYLVGLGCSLIALNNTFYHYISTIFTYKL